MSDDEKRIRESEARKQQEDIRRHEEGKRRQQQENDRIKSGTGSGDRPKR